MRRPIPQQDLENGQDSFLDVVSNIVGILIILVVVVGAQVKSGLTSHRMKELEKQKSEITSLEETLPLPVPDSDSDSVPGLETEPEMMAENGVEPEIPPELQPEPQLSAEERQELEAKLAAAGQCMAETAQIEQRLGTEIGELQVQKARMEAEQEAFAEEIVQMASTLALIQKELETKTSEKDLKNRELLALTQDSVQIQRKIKELEAKIKSLAEEKVANGGPKMIEHKMTPIVHSVDSQEVHFMLEHGHIMYVPLEELMKEYERKIPGMMQSLMQSGVRTEVLGPYDGFRLHTETRLQGGKVGVYLKVIPPDIEVEGETLEEALAVGSKFRYYLEKLNPAKDTLTFWIYPTGFGTFIPIKSEVYRLGFAVAMRPLPEGTPIAGSPNGQRSQAQ